MSHLEQIASADLAAPTMLGQRVVRVNLLPDEIDGQRRLRIAQVGLVLGLLAVIGACAVAYVLAVGARNSASDDLTAMQALGTKLQAEQTKYADVPRILSAIDSAELARQTAMASDVQWHKMMVDLQYTQVNRVWFTSLTMTVNADAATAAAAAAKAKATTNPSKAAGSSGTTGSGTTSSGTTGTTTTPSTATTATTTQTSSTGQISVDGYAYDHPDVANWLDIFGKRVNLSDAYFTNSSREKIGTSKVVKFSSTAQLTDAALSHLYDRKQG
jgi:hypothetical protein